MAAIVQTPGVSQLMGCRPLGPIGWGIGLSAAASATAASVVLPRVIGDLPSWVTAVTRVGVTAPEGSADPEFPTVPPEWGRLPTV
jgi:H+-transporting ATPase